MSNQWLVTIPDGFTLRIMPFTAYPSVNTIAITGDTEGLLGSGIFSGLVTIEAYIPPVVTPPDTPPPAPVVVYVCVVTKVNRRAQPNASSEDVGDVFLNGTVNIVEVLPKDSRGNIWGKTDIGDYVMLKFQAEDYFRVSTTGG